LKFKHLKYLILSLFSFASVEAQAIVPQNQKHLVHDSVHFILIEGLKRTQLKTVYREINFNGEFPFFVNDSLLNRWEKRLSSLNLFTDVELRKNSDSLIILVTEEFYFWINPEGGFADRNFRNWLSDPKLDRLYLGGDFIFYNLYGLNHTLTFTMVGGFNQQLGIGYEWPNNKFGDGWLGKIEFNYSLNHEIWASTIDNRVVYFKIEPKYAQGILSGALKMTKKFSYEKGLELNYTFDQFSIDESVLNLNLNYIGGSNKLTSNALSIGFIYDSRDQKHYPISGSELKIFGEVQYTVSISNQYNILNNINFKWRKFIPLNQLYSFGSVIQSQYKFGKLNYLQSRQLGYTNDFVRGYELYVVDGNGFFISKLSLRREIINRKLKVKDFSGSNFYSKMPIQSWLTFFFDYGRVLNLNQNEVENGNTFQKSNLNSLGISLDILAYYDLLSRFDIARNYLGQWIFNISFKHAI
jgi:hypothetical protein